MVKRLLFVVNDAGFFVSHRLPIALEAQKKGYEVHICTPSNNEMEARFQKEGFTFHASPLKRGKSDLIKEIKYIKYLFDLYKKYNFDIIHHVTIKPVLFGGIAARFAKVNAVVSAISGMGYIFIKQGLKASLTRRLVIAGYRFAFKQRKHRIIFQNEDDLNLFLKHRIIQKEQARLIKGSGVDLTEFKAAPVPPAPLKVILPARMLWDKGVGEFVEAARMVKKEYPEIIFQLAGGVDTENPAGIAEEQLKAWQEESIVEWLGYCDNVAELFQHAHIVCLPSYREGLPKALIEAMGCARAIITTDVPGCREVVNHMQNGILVPLKSPQEIADAVVLLAKNSKMLHEMGQASRKRAEEEFALSIVVNQTLELYEDI